MQTSVEGGHFLICLDCFAIRLDGVLGGAMLDFLRLWLVFLVCLT